MNQTPAVISTFSGSRAPTSSRSSTASSDLLPQLQASLPSAVDVPILTDRTTTIRASVEDVQFELMLTVALVVMVIFLFLRNRGGHHHSERRRAAVARRHVRRHVSARVQPEQPDADGADDLDRLRRRRRDRDDRKHLALSSRKARSPLQAALKGSEQIGFTIVSLTVSLIAVLIPLLFMGDIVGRLFREFAITLAVTILVSAVVSLTLTPMMCAQLLRHKPESQQGRFFQASERAFDCGHRSLRSTLAVGAAASDGYAAGHGRDARDHAVPSLYRRPKGFFPVQDTGVILGISEAPQPISFHGHGASASRRLAQVILQDPAVESLSSFIGVDGTNATMNSGRIQINLKPLRERTASATAVIQPPAAEDSQQLTASRSYMQPVQDLTVEDRVSRTQFQYSLEDADARELNEWAPRLVAELDSAAPVARRRERSADSGLEASLVIDRDTAVAVRHHAASDRRHALRRVRPAAGLDDLHAVEPVSRGAGGRSRLPAESRSRWNISIVANVQRRAGAAERLHALRDRPPRRSRSTTRGSSRWSRCRSISRPAFRSATPSRRSMQAERARSACPRAFRPSFQGTAAGVPDVARQRAVADSGGARHRLHRARRAVRKLHPSDHDPFDAAVGGRRRDSGAADLPARISRRSR